MKHLFLPVLFLVLCITGTAQTLVTTEVTKKHAILEEFTGIHCGYCPDGHKIAAEILEENPGKAVVIAIHQGSYATPSAGEPDYRTEFGDAIAGQTGLTGYPSGTVNRHVFTGSNTALSRSAWKSSCKQIMAEDSPVNVGIMSSYDAGTRQLTIDVELYYTADGPAGTNYINVALLQDSIYGPQSSGGAGNNYRHMHMLRYLITGQWGEAVTPVTAGTLITEQYTYVVPDNYRNIPALVEDMQVAVFVTKDHQEILSGDVVNAIGGTNLYIGNIENSAAKVMRSIATVPVTFNTNLNSNIAGSSSFEITLTSNNSPADWNASFVIDGTTYSGSATINVDKGTPKPMAIIVTPGSSAAFPEYTITMKSLSNPNAPLQYSKVYVVSGVTDLVVNGTGGPETTLWQDTYLNGLGASGITSYAVTNANVFTDMVNDVAFKDVFNVYMNIAWTFPALTDDQATALMAFMDAGHNVLIAGQDIGWDIMSGADGSNGTAITRNFYSNYLLTDFVDDGSSTNNKLTANTADPVFGEVPQSTIVDRYSGNMYPDVIKPKTGADYVFHYVNDTKKSATKCQTDKYRAIYFGVGLEMLSDETIRNQIITISRIWLTGDMVGIDFNEAANSILTGNCYPNPASSFTFLPISGETREAVVEVLNANGSVVATQSVNGQAVLKLDVSNLSSGIYFWRVKSNGQVTKGRQLQVVR